MNFRLWGYAAALCMGALTPACAQSLKMPLETEPFRESLTDLAPVGGRVLVGVVTRPLHPSGSLITPIVAIKDVADAQRLCVSVVTRDGRYRSDNSYSILHSEAASQANLDFPTRYGRHLQQIDPEDIAVLAEKKADCGTPDHGVVVPTSLHGARSGELILFINSGGSLVTVSAMSEASSKNAACEPVRKEGATAYDTKCTVDVTDLNGPLKVKIMRKLFERRLPAIVHEVAAN